MNVTRTVHFRRGKRSEQTLQEGPCEKPRGRVPRVAKLLALAIRFEQTVRDGVVPDYAEIARLGHVTRARMSQIMSLLSLSPELQEWVLCLPLVESGNDPITERDLRPIATKLDWKVQRRQWTVAMARRGEIAKPDESDSL